MTITAIFKYAQETDICVNSPRFIASFLKQQKTTATHLFRESIWREIKLSEDRKSSVTLPLCFFSFLSFFFFFDEWAHFRPTSQFSTHTYSTHVTHLKTSLRVIHTSYSAYIFLNSGLAITFTS